AFSPHVIPGGQAIKRTGGDAQTPQLKPETRTNPQPSHADARAHEDRELRRLKDEVDARARKLGMADKVKTQVTRRGLVIDIPTKQKVIAAWRLLLVRLDGVYKFVRGKPAEPAMPKVDGEVYVLPREVLINLSDGQFVKLDVALGLKRGALPAAGGEAAAAAPPEGFGALPQEAVVRDIVTNSLTGVSGAKLIHRKGREQLKKRILRQILKKTDVKAEDVLFTDVAVQ